MFYVHTSQAADAMHNHPIFPIFPMPEDSRRTSSRNKRVPFERRDERPEHPRIIYPPILDINYFCHFLNILENYNPMDDEPMWAADRVVAPNLGSAITIPETANEFFIKDILKNYNPMDDEAMWATDRVVTPTLGSAIIVPKTANEFAIKDTENEAVHL
nr:hypothetical protein [Tanacetum cinerariifolium]